MSNETKAYISLFVFYLSLFSFVLFCSTKYDNYRKQLQNEQIRLIIRQEVGTLLQQK